MSKKKDCRKKHFINFCRFLCFWYTFFYKLCIASSQSICPLLLALRARVIVRVQIPRVYNRYNHKSLGVYSVV